MILNREAEVDRQTDRYRYRHTHTHTCLHTYTHARTLPTHIYATHEKERSSVKMLSDKERGHAGALRHTISGRIDRVRTAKVLAPHGDLRWSTFFMQLTERPVYVCRVATTKSRRPKKWLRCRLSEGEDNIGSSHAPNLREATTCWLLILYSFSQTRATSCLECVACEVSAGQGINLIVPPLNWDAYEFPTTCVNHYRCNSTLY